MKNLKLVLLAIGLLHAHVALAMVGTEGGNGGDMCENRFKLVRDDLFAWIRNGGSAGLALPGFDLAIYNSEMIAGIERASISCTNDKVLLRGVEKTCKNFVDEVGAEQILCNADRFLTTDESEQYVLVHHEYAGIAGFEVNGEDGSKYFISNQITGYLENQLVKRLVVNPDRSSGVIALPIRSESIHVGAFTRVEKQFAMYRRLLERAGRVVRNIQLGEENGYGHLFSISFDHFTSRNLRCNLAKHDMETGAFEDLEKKIDKQFKLMEISDNRWVDMEILSTSGTGSISAIRVYFCQ